MNKNVLVCDPRYVLNLSHSVIIRSLTFGSSKTMGLANFVEFHGLQDLSYYRKLTMHGLQDLPYYRKLTMHVANAKKIHIALN